MNNCVFHSDKRPSLAINMTTGKWKCYTPTCPGHAGGGWKKFEELLTGKIPSAGEIKPPPIDPAAIEAFHEVLLASKTPLAMLRDKRGFTDATIKKFKLGYDGTRVLIPILSQDGSIVNVRKYLYGAQHMPPGPDGKPPDKFIAWGPRFNTARLYPAENLKHQLLYVFEGELDTLLACQLGLPAITSTNGADAWMPQFNDLLRGKDLIFCYDVDPAGRKGAQAHANNVAKVAKSVRIATLPLAGNKDEKDFTDYIVHLNHTVDDFDKVIARAEEVKNLVTNTEPPPEVEDIHLSRIGLDKYVGRRVRSTVLVAGKDLAPFQVPKKVAYSCGAVGSMKQCDVCGICQKGGQLEVEVPNWSQAMLQMVDTPIEKLNAHLARLADVPDRCPKFKFEIKEHQNVESVKVIPEIDFTAEDAEYVIRRLFYLGTNLETNRTYILTAVVMPDPKNQYATALIYEATPSQDSIEKFELTPDVLEMLKLFNVEG